MVIDAFAIFAYLAANARRLDDIVDNLILRTKVVHVALLVDSHKCHVETACFRRRDDGGAALDGIAARIKVRNVPLCMWFESV